MKNTHMGLAVACVSGGLSGREAGSSVAGSSCTESLAINQVRLSTVTVAAAQTYAVDARLSIKKRNEVSPV